LSEQVAKAHETAREAQKSVGTAKVMAGKAQSGLQEIKDVPPEMILVVANLVGELNQAQSIQMTLDKQLQEADKQDAEARRQISDYIGAAGSLAAQATRENEARIKAEKSLSWYRWHWWGSWIVFGLGVLAVLILAFLKFTGKLVTKL